ncbi:MAG TPA: TonB family protein [Burkholderiales bacterium]|nr:TonB family protein [Burkholderiales bacterium]
MRPASSRFLRMLAVSLVLHAVVIWGAGPWLMPPAPFKPLPAMEARIEVVAARKEDTPAPAPRVIKNTFEPSSAGRRAATRPVAPPGSNAPAALARAEPTPEAHLGEALKRISDTLLYPPEAVREGLEGEVVLVLDLGEGGRILEAAVASGSGHRVLDDAALRAALRLGSLSPTLAGKAILLPVRFRLL